MKPTPMKTKIVYAVISGTDDYYLEQLIFSIMSLKRYNPTAYIEVVTDDATKRSLTEWRAILCQMVDYLNIVDMPQGFNKMNVLDT